MFFGRGCETAKTRLVRSTFQEPCSLIAFARHRSTSGCSVELGNHVHLHLAPPLPRLRICDTTALMDTIYLSPAPRPSVPPLFRKSDDPSYLRDNVALLVVVDVLLRSQSPTGEGSTGGGDTPEPSASGGTGPAARLVIANTHLVFNPKRGDVKAAQLMLLTGKVERQAEVVVGEQKREFRLKSVRAFVSIFVEQTKAGTARRLESSLTAKRPSSTR